MTDYSPNSGQRSFLAVWGLPLLKGLVALAFGAAAILKLSGSAKMVTEFGEIGLGQWFRYFTGAIELAGATFLLVPRLTFVASLALLGVCVGALVAQIAILHGDLIHVVVLGGLLAWLAWLSKQD